MSDYAARRKSDPNARRRSVPALEDASRDPDAATRMPQGPAPDAPTAPKPISPSAAAAAAIESPPAARASPPAAAAATWTLNSSHVDPGPRAAAASGSDSGSEAGSAGYGGGGAGGRNADGDSVDLSSEWGSEFDEEEEGPDLHDVVAIDTDRFASPRFIHTYVHARTHTHTHIHTLCG